MRIYLCNQKKYDYAVSVIIPMFNAEKYIGECLDSLLIQTFQDFEVIVVDDCSTDKSAKIVESYAEQFDGRLRLTKTEKSSSGPGIARNIGIKLARGEFIQFIDADDFILNTAIEILYNEATRHTADIVNTSSYYRVNAPNDIFVHRDGFSKSLLKRNKEIKAFFKLDKQQENLNRLLLMPGEGEFHSCWSKFYRRDFLINNKIFFPNLAISEDYIFVINVYCHAKRFLHIPTPFYFYRLYNDSSTRVMRPTEAQLLHWITEFVDFAKNLYELERNNSILAENPLYCLMTLKTNLVRRLDLVAKYQNILDEEDIYKILHQELVKNSSDSTNLLLPFFFTLIGTERKLNDYQSPIIKNFKQYFTARLDIKLTTDKTDGFEIISVSDDKTVARKPGWINKNGIGYMIQSYAGEIKFIAKTAVEGELRLLLRGIDVRYPEDKTKRIPYWIDYTKLVVNEQVIFDKITPVWHDKSYIYKMQVKAGEEIKIQVEWLPHRSDT